MTFGQGRDALLALKPSAFGVNRMPEKGRLDTPAKVVQPSSFLCELYKMLIDHCCHPDSQETTV